MELKHSPAPWLIAGEDKSFVYALGHIGTNKFWAHVQAAGPEKIGKEEKEANAHLIAASPTLYDFCLKKAKDGDKEARSMLSSLQLLD